MHKTNSPESQGNITYAVLPDGSADVWIRKNEVQLPEKDEGPQGMEADEIYFKVSAGVVPKEEIVADLDFWFDQLKDKEEGCNADYLSIETYRAEKKKEISQICQSTVFAGVDISISSGTEHFTGRVLFWLHHAIVKGEHNGELEEAFENLQRAEEHKKEMDREVLAKYSID